MNSQCHQRMSVESMCSDAVVSNDSLDNVRRSLQEANENLKLVFDLVGEDNGKNDCSTKKAKLALSKQEYHKLKPDSQTLQTKLQVLEYLVNVSEDNWPTLQSKDDEYKKVYEEKKKVNSELLDMEDEILDVVESAQEKIILLKNKISTAEQKISSITSKMQKYEELITQHKEFLAKCQLQSFNKSDNVTDIVKQKSERVKYLEASLENANSLVTALTASISEHEENLQQLRETVRKVLKILQVIAEQKQEKGIKIVENTMRCEKYTALINKLFLVRENSSTGNTWSVDLVPSNDDNEKVTLDIQKKLHQHCDVKIISDTIDMNSVAKDAMDYHDISYMIQEIRKKYTTHAPLAKEIDNLRQRFAVDFLQDENVLICMFGSGGNIVCRLYIEPGYPTNGHVSLQKITGQPIDTTPSFHPTIQNPTLTDWLEYLQQILV